MILLKSNKIVETEEQTLINLIRDKSLKLSLHVILVGEHEPSLIYVNRKKQACERVGIKCVTHTFKNHISEEHLIKLIKDLNLDISVHAILVQLPLPDHMNKQKIIESIDFKKDVDGLTSKNIANLVMGEKGIVPCTPLGCLDLIKHFKPDIKGLHAVIIGRSNLVGKPLFHLLLNEDMTVTIAHSKTKNLIDITNKADILISAIGHAKFITKEFIKSGAIVIDVGINRSNDSIQGDIDFEDVKDQTSAITPVPGGVGPMTVLNLLKNTLLCHELLHDSTR